MRILQIGEDGKLIREWTSVSDAANALCLDRSHIRKCLIGKRLSHGGFKWSYLSNDEGDEDANSESLESKSFDYKSDSAILSAKTEKSITSLEEAIEFFEVDTTKWEVERFIVNSWDVTGTVLGKRTNYQVKVYLKPREETTEEVVVKLNDILEKYVPKNINITKGSGVITANFADFHIGAEIKNLTRTKDFDIKILADYLYSSAELINSHNAQSVVVNLHGDFFESISGLNHLDSWKSIGTGMFGANVIILANELLGSALLSNINNLKEVNIVSGNHDRISASNKEDQYGEGAKLLAWVLQKDFPKLNINFNPLILVREIDGINHILTHGHHGISKKDLSKVVMDYGNNKIFNLWTEGHLHSRKTKKVLKTQIATYDEVDVVELDDLKYRKITLGPMFTGNFFSESLGYAGHAGVIVTENNGKGIPHIHDYTI